MFFGHEWTEQQAENHAANNANSGVQKEVNPPVRLHDVKQYGTERKSRQQASACNLSEENTRDKHTRQTATKHAGQLEILVPDRVILQVY